MRDHAHIQLEKNNTDFICNHKPVAQRLLLWEYTFFSSVSQVFRGLMGVLNVIRTTSATILFYSRRLRK